MGVMTWAGAHPLVAVATAVVAGVDGRDAVGVVDVAAGVLAQLPAPARHAPLAGRSHATVVAAEVLVGLVLVVLGFEASRVILRRAMCESSSRTCRRS